MRIRFLLFAAVCSVTFATNGYAADLLAYWEFNDAVDVTTAVDSTIGREGALEGTTYTVDAGGRTGTAGDYAMDFGVDTNGQLVRADGSFLNTGTDTVTFSFWQKLSAVASTSSFWAVSPSSSGSERGAQAHVPWSNGIIYFDTVGCCDPPQRLSGVADGHDFTEWSHYAFVKNGENKEVWINGELVLSSSGAAALPTDFTELILGADGLGGNSLQGQLDDFAVFSDALSGDLIGRLAAGESAKTIPEPSSCLLLLFGLLGLTRIRRGQLR